MKKKETRGKTKTTLRKHITIKQDLQDFYNQEASKYHETRKKYRKEGERILEAIDALMNKPLALDKDIKKSISILEIGCGSGRFASYLREHYQGKFTYVGVDLSQELLAYAKKDNPKGKFICEDMSEFIVRQKQEKFDLIIGTSSFQHIPTYRERLFLMKFFYKLLKYDGLLIMTNWSFSKRFFRKHWKEVLKSRGQWLVGGETRRDCMVPRTNGEKTFKRYYHLFSLQELKKLTTFSGLNLEHLSYLDDKGEWTRDWRTSKSSFLVAKKSPITHV
jgi:tRNA (cmo5U34)-methyltransferase